MWAVIEARPNFERRINRKLSAEGFATYLAEYRNAARHRALLLPRYLFVRPAEHWRKVFRISGVLKLFTWGSGNEMRPALIEDKFVKDLRAREDDYGVIALPGRSSFERGEQLRILRGAFQGMIGIYERPRDEYDEVCVGMFGRQVRERLHHHDLERLA